MPHLAFAGLPQSGSPRPPRFCRPAERPAACC